MADDPPPKKCVCEESAPVWMISYGDMITLTLCFFVILFASADVTKNYDKIKTAVTIFSESMSEFWGSTKMETNKSRFAAFRKAMEAQLMQGLKERSITLTANLFKMTMAWNMEVLFEKGRAELKPSAKKELGETVRLLKGYNFKIEVIGHCARTPEEDDWQLSWDRAHKVSDFLTREGGLSEKCIKVSAVKFYEPLDPKAYKASDSRNSRISIVVNNERVDERDKAEQQ